MFKQTLNDIKVRKSPMKSWVKGLLIFPLVLLMMGNQNSCQAPAGGRKLKKIVELEKISSQPVNLGSSGSFDFEFVANQQIITVLESSGDFSFRLLPPVQPASRTSSMGADGLSKISVDQKVMNMPETDNLLMKQWLAKSSQKPAEFATESKEAWCMVNNPQAKLRGSVNSFEMLGGGGLSIGFSPVGVHAVSLGLVDVKLEFLQLDLSLHALSPLTQQILASSNVTSKQTKTRLGFGLNLGMLTLGPSFFFQTPLAKVTKAALAKAVTGLKAELDAKEWFTRVLVNKDEELVIVGGTNVNLKPGDQLAFYNEIYYWVGEPCNSKLQYDGIARAPVALGVVDTVGGELAFVKVTHQEEEKVQIGATVRLVRLAEDVPPPAAPSAAPSAPLAGGPGK